MYYPSKKEFVSLSSSGNVIPVYREMLADFDTPISAFIKMDGGQYAYLLESVEGGENLGRFSFLGSDPHIIIESKGDKVTVTKNGSAKTHHIKKDPLDEIKSIMKSYKFVHLENLPRFCGGLVGYIGYDAVRFIERIPDKNPDEINAPDMLFMFTDTIIIFDHVARRVKVVANAVVDGDAEEAYDKACLRIDGMVERLKRVSVIPEVKTVEGSQPEVESNFSEKDFCSIVESAKEHIKAGDIIQIVLSQRLKRKTRVDAFSIYRALRSINPSPYMFFLKFRDFRIVGSSPEILVRYENGQVEVRPIAGTRRRGEDRTEDELLERELLSDPKERAEHIMLLDLGRNDVGRVCEYGSVRPREVMRIERYSHVMHIVSDVVGSLRKDKDVYDLIRATFPAGTVSGAPKVKAMELIDKFENVHRGPYAGSVGYISFSGNMDMCITIRTMIVKNDTVYLQSGAGIVLDSDPVTEYKETLNKAKAMVKAIEFAERGLQ